MFKKLVSNLPFNPSLINQVGFYADRLKQETSVRRLGFLFMALAMMVQSFAVIRPPEKSYAIDDSHLMSGLKTRADILRYYDNPNSNVKSIFDHYGLTRGDIASLSDKPNDSIFTNDGKDWWTVGTYSLQLRNDVAQKYKDSERPVEYSAGRYVYERQWRAFDIINKKGQHRKAWKGTVSATGQTFWIVQSCGNLTWVGKFTPPPTPTPTPEPEPSPKPKLEIKKSLSKNGPLKPGDTFVYQIEYRNKKSGSASAQNVEITDQIDIKNLEVVSPKNMNLAASGYVTIPIGSLPFSPEFKLFEITVRIKDPIPNGTEICNNGASISASNASKATSKKRCLSVIVPCKYDESINTNDPNCIKPIVKCSLLDAGINLAERRVRYKTTVTSSNNRLVAIDSYDYDFGDGNQASINSNEFTNEIEHTYEPGSYTANVVVGFSAPTESGQTKQTAECSKDIEFEEEDPLGQLKFVKNITRDLKGEDAINSKVRAGEELEYTLQTLNSNNYDRSGITIEDYIGDLLDYATLDEEALKASGGRFDEESKKVLWENVTIPANSKLETKFKIKMVDPIPSTNRPSDQGSNFDCVISNMYGNKISLDVSCPLVKGIETLPNTGPGTSLVVGGIATAFIGYFFARARLLSKELVIIRSDYINTGGM